MISTIKRSRERYEWYSNPEVVYNLLGVIHSREVVFLSKVKGVMTARYNFAHYANILRSHMNYWNFFKKEYNVYYSLAQYNPIMRFSYSLQQRPKDIAVFNDSIYDRTVGFDWGLDFDGLSIEDYDDAYNDCKLVKGLFDKYKLPYTLKWSGGAGFHLKVPCSALPNKSYHPDDEDNIYEYLKHVTELLNFKYELKSLDMGIYDPRRIWKADYSYTCENGTIVLPLTDEQFERFSVELVSFSNVVRMPIRNRGDLCREGAHGAFKRLLKEELGVSL